MADACARCGYPRKEHSYNGACYGLCGKFEEEAVMFQIGDEVIAGVGSVFFRGFVRTPPFVWRGQKHVVVTNMDQMFVAEEKRCQHARPVLVVDVEGGRDST